MYLITFIIEGIALKAKTEKEVKTWLRDNVQTSFSWRKLRRKGEVKSNCRHWKIRKVDGRKTRDVETIDNFIHIQAIGILKKSNQS